jgi:hypothetical protein
MAYIAPDPLAGVSPDYPTGPNVSTLRITSAPVEAEWAIVQDYRTKSVLNGFAGVGGLGSFFSIIFVILFGNTLLGLFRRTLLTLVYARVQELTRRRIEATFTLRRFPSP